MVSKSNNIYLVKLTVIAPDSGFAAWLGEEVGKDQTPEDVIKQINNYALVAMEKGGRSSNVSLLTWHRRLGHPAFKAVVELLRGVSRMVITDVPEKIPGLDSCTACVAGKSCICHTRGEQGHGIPGVHAYRHSWSDASGFSWWLSVCLCGH